MKFRRTRKKQKGMAERKTETTRRKNVPYKAIGMGLILWLMTTWLFFGMGTFRHVALTEGRPAPFTILAAVDFSCENLKETAFQRNQAAVTAPTAFTLNPAPARQTIAKVTTLFDRLAELAAAPEEQQLAIDNSIDELLIGSNTERPEWIEAFPTNHLDEIKTALLSTIRREIGRGILSEESRQAWFRDTPNRQMSITTTEGIARTVDFKNVVSAQQTIDAICQTLEEKSQRHLCEQLLAGLITSNLSYDAAATEVLRKNAVEAVPPMIQHYSAGTEIIRDGEMVTPQTQLMFKTHEQQRIAKKSVLEQLLDITGNGFMLLIGLAATAIILRITAPAIIHRPDQILLLIILSLATLSIARLLIYFSGQRELIPSHLLSYLVPHAMAVMLAGILLGGKTAIALGFWTSFATATLFDQSFTVFTFGMLVTVTATSTAHNVHKRSSLFQAGLWLCAVKMLFLLVTALLNRPTTLSELGGQTSVAILSSVFSTVLTLLMIPVFEKLFKITTDITLLELSDMGHPLLQKMAMQAPGTYHHSLMVATLAQNAAEAIGANSLLVRVCAYYHDIGKMAKPEFFTENIQHKENPHDELSPHMSALVISSHVKEGLALARRHKLPQPILDAIEQHHGNGLISFFYNKAKNMLTEDNSGGAETINDSDFRYGGAPAATPEMAILALADSSEAASRSLEKPNPQKITNLIDDIFAGKIRDGQMDGANLTMAQINVIKRSFIFSLTNMLHGRIPYPKDNENSPSKSAEKPSAPPEKN